MSDTEMSPMSLPSCMYSSEPSCSSVEYTGTIKQVDMILIKEEEQQVSFTPIGINGACVFPQRSPPDYIDAVYQNRSYTFPNQPNTAMYSNANYVNNTNRINHGNGVVKRKRIRTAFTTNQLKDLEEQYRINRYLERGTRMFLSRKLNVSERIIKIWFQNRRMKEKKDRAECQVVDSCTLPAQSTSNSHGTYVPPIPTYNILPQDITNSGIMNCDSNYIHETNHSVNFGVTPVMEEQHVFTTLPRDSPTATTEAPFDRFSNNMPPPYESEITSTVFSDFSQYCDAYSE